ncbi:MAG: metallophosphoesterase, partial [Deltaproteobacteria bacterium]
MIFKRKRRWYVALFTLVLLLLMAKAYFDTNTIEVRRYTIQGSPLGEALSGLKVAFLSDLHLRESGLREKKLLEILGREKPDLILLAGDLIAFKGPSVPALSFFEQLRAPLGAFAVLGNTEYSNENGSCILCHRDKSKDLKQTGNPIVLRNSTSLLKVNGKVVTLAGIDDPVTERGDLK